MNYICTWLCADEKGEESIFYQTGKLSSSRDHQNIYWRCLLVMYMSSKRFNRKEKHLLFTNVKTLPVVDGRDMKTLLDDLNVEVIHTDFRYKTPRGYYGAFQNQFYEFSILEYISANFQEPSDQFLILDSDCIFLKPAARLFAEAALNGGFVSYEDNVLPDYVINGLSRRDMKGLYEELLGHPIPDFPAYHYGEFLLCSLKNIRAIYKDFTVLWPQLLKRHVQGRLKFNEEAHTLSYLYYKNELRSETSTVFMKRIWTNPLFYRDAEPSDIEKAIWHLPAEKTFGLFRIYDYLMNRSSKYGADISDQEYIELVQQLTGIPHLPLKLKLEYYTVSYLRAFKKRFNKISLKAKAAL